MRSLPTSPHLDVRNVMWLLAAMVFVVAPHLIRMPYWVAVFFVAIVGWRGWIAWAAMHFPGRFVTSTLTIAAAIATYFTYTRIVGREAGVTLLVVMSALKLLEMKTQREVTLSVYLGFFLVLTNFLFSQTIPLGVYMLACVWIFIGTMVGFNRVGSSPTLGERMRPAGALLIQALPLMVACFVLFPRAAGPLWALPTDTRSGTTGLSDTMRPGNIVFLKNLAAGGALVHSKRPLVPGTRVHLQIAGGTHRLRIGGQILRCGVAAIGVEGVTYLGAVRFDNLCDLPWEEWLGAR